MTDASLPVDQALVDRATFEKEAVWMPNLAVHHFNAGKIGVEGKTFTDCLIEGPAVLMVLDDVSFDGCSMGVTGDPDNLLIKPVGEKLTGVIPVRNCKFVRCEFLRVAYTGSPEFLSGFSEGLRSMSAEIRKAAEAGRLRGEGSAS